jgi:hypothetical protein
MAPPIARVAFATGLTVFLLALLVLPSLEPDSAEFVADVLALIISGLFLLLVVVSVRRAAYLPDVSSPEESRNSNQDGGDLSASIRARGDDEI